MVSPKRQQKADSIIDAAEEVFFRQGYAEAKMEDVAKKAGMSKGSLYFYFSSKEDLYMAISYRALQMLIDIYHKAIADHRDKPGFQRVMATFRGYLAFSEKYFHYHEALFNYMSLIREQSAGGTKQLSENLQNSLYFAKIQDLHNLPVKLVVQEIEAGKADGSITNPAPSAMIYLTNWALVAGFIKLNLYGGRERTSIYQVNLQEWKEHIIETASALLKG